MAKTQSNLMLLPVPQSVRRSGGTLKLKGRVLVSLPPEAGGPELHAARQLGADLARHGVEVGIARRATNAGKTGTTITLRRGRVRGGDEAYTLRIVTGGIEVTAPGAAGLYYGLQTLRQLVRKFGTKLPTLTVTDWPDFPMRAVYHDISRGRVPTLDTLKYLVELLGHLKVNQLQLYMEYPFRYERHPQVWEDTRPLTAEEILELQRFAALHCVELVPSQASFGHLERLLSKPPYRHLANTEPRKNLADTRRPGQTGTSLDPTNPGSIKLLGELYDELLPQFDAPQFNACCDEVWDLGQGKSQRRARRVGKTGLFAEFVRKIDKLSRRHGKRMMIWADIFRHYPDEMTRAAAAIPDDVILCNWWYYPHREQECMVDHSRLIRRSGHDLVVCPGVNNWGAFMPRVGVMRENIRLFAKAGKAEKALGLLNTEWGDGGHFNLLATALPGFATGAEYAWAPDRADDKTIGRRWPLHVLGDTKGIAEKIIRLADYGSGEQRQVFTGFGDERELDLETLGTTAEKLLERQQTFNGRVLKAMDEAIGLSHALESVSWDDPAVPNGFQVSMEYAALTAFLLAKGYAICGELERRLGNDGEARRHFSQAAEATDDLLPDYREMWLRRNHESELDWSVGRLKKAARRWRRTAKKK